MDKANDLVAVTFDPASMAVGVHGSAPLFSLVVIAVLAVPLWRWFARGGARGWAIDAAVFDFPGGNVSLKRIKPSYADRQVAYAIWVELKTRKIGLPIDLDNDTIAEVYDSWYSLFNITRTLIKTVPVESLTAQSTRAIVDLCVDVLNLGLRPHLTRWQARFRRWYEQELATKTGGAGDDPQTIQRRFPEYKALAADLLLVNEQLIAYRDKMEEIVYRAT